MSPIAGFLTFLLLTLAGLGAVFWTGLRRKRKQHIPLVFMTIAFLGLAIFYAERLGEGLDLEKAGWIYPVHLVLAKVTTVAYLAPVLSGFAVLRNPARRGLHGKLAWAVLLLTVLTAGTGAWMVWASPVLSV